MKRRKFIQYTSIIGGGLAAGGVGFSVIFDKKTSHQPLQLRKVRFTTLAEAREEVERLEKAKDIVLSGEWDLYQNLIHCSQSIEYSLTGYPMNRNAVFQNTLGNMAFKKFNKQGYMAHFLNEPIPEAPEIRPKGELDRAFFRLRKAIDDFQRHQGVYKQHFAYGELTKKEYELAHAMHLADHFSGISYS